MPKLNKLTKREYNILVALVSDMSRKEILEDRCISRSTLQTHIDSISSKLYLNTSTRACDVRFRIVKKALQLKLISVDELLNTKKVKT